MIYIKDNCNKINRLELHALKGDISFSKQRAPSFINYSVNNANECSGRGGPPHSQPMNEFSVSSLFNLLPSLQTEVLNLAWKVAYEHCEASIYTFRLQGEVNML